MKPIYDRALDLSNGERDRLLADACGADIKMKEELVGLLGATDTPTSTLNHPFLPQLADAADICGETLAIGELIAGRFKIVRRVGSGGMGDIYEAIDTALDSGRIALKTIRPEIAEDASILARFRSEVLLARRVTGPHVCRIHELFVPPQPSGRCGAFLTMEFLEGITLSEKIRSGPIPLSEATSIAKQLCIALQCIHEAGVIHRDLKPRNVMVVPQTGSEKIVVMDFGLARVLAREADDGKTAITVPGAVMGTPAYMAPEQFEGFDVSPATDIYALGLVLYELVTGRRPFAGTKRPSVGSPHSGLPTPASSIRRDLPVVWDRIIEKCLENDQSLRFQSAAEVLDKFSVKRPELFSFSRRDSAVPSRRPLLGVSVAFFLLITLVSWFWISKVRYRPPSPEVSHWYELGMVALRESSYLKATKALNMAIEADKGFALGHASLADAWSELDFTGEAQREMLLATAPERLHNLREVDRRYIDAVRKTLVRDYSSAVQDYEDILKELPKTEKAHGLIDLGRAYEKAGKIKETLASYEEAAAANPDDPAPFLHLGILKSRERDEAGAEAGFSKAEMLYRAESNPEGLAEVDYQRGYAANEAALSGQATKYLTRSLAQARQISSVQLEVRSLLQLCSVAYYDSKDDQAIDLANQAVDLARTNGLEYWSTDGLMRLGNAYFDKEDFDKADQLLTEALTLAKKSEHPRLQAAAEFALASLRGQQGRWDEEIGFAKLALKYYADYGFLDRADEASAMIVRGERDRGDFTKAEQASMELLRLAHSIGKPLSIQTAEELTGTVFMATEEFPEALKHFENALQASQSVPQYIPYQRLHCASALWRLGRYAEAQTMLDAIPSEAAKRRDIGIGIQMSRAEMQLSRLDFRDAFMISNKALTDNPGLSLGPKTSFERIRALSEAHLNMSARARFDGAQIIAAATKSGDARQLVAAQLTQSEIALLTRDLEGAKVSALDAAQSFATSGQRDSEWSSLRIAAASLHQLGDRDGARDAANKGLDISQQMRKSWGETTFTTFISRPDRQGNLFDSLSSALK